MFIPGVPLSRSIIWGVIGRQFRFTVAGDRLTLDTSDGRLTLSRHEWQGVAAALASLEPLRAREPQFPGEATSNRRAWSPDDDAALCDGWYAGNGLAALAGRLGRTEGAVTARLVRLDLVGDRAEARRRP
ncbi:hypothetical protein [Sphingomonas sp.]|uniref:hypothetical protein n=1 Tax=Sphingomonas sp. TaxID=28214 RepID=UPI003B00A666